MSNPYIEKIIEISNGSKYVEYYLNIIERAEQRVSNRQQAKEMFGYVESHHILPRSFGLGGDTDPVNIVHLSAREHFITHWILVKIFTKGSTYHRKMSHALNNMSFGNSKNLRYHTYITSRVYERNRLSLDKMLGKKCVVDGIEYQSIREAAEALNLTKACIRKRTRSTSYPSYNLVGEEKSILRWFIRPVVIDQITYKSIPEAAEALGIPVQKIRYRVKNKNFINYFYVDEPKTEQKRSGKESQRTSVSKPVEIHGIIYKSIQEAATAMNIKYVTVQARIKSKSPIFSEYRFADEVVNKPKIVIDGVEYPSARQAGIILGLKGTLVHYRINSNAYPNYKVIG